MDRVRSLRDRGHGGGEGCNDADGEVGATVRGCDCGSSDQASEHVVTVAGVSFFEWGADG